MTDFGRYRLTYEPGSPDMFSGILEHGVEMSISGEADLPQLLGFFEAFLKASGYVFDGELKIQAPEKTQNERVADFWFEDGYSLTGNPYASPDTIVFSGTGLPGALGDDGISFASKYDVVKLG